MTDVPPLTPEEVRTLRSVLKGFSAAEWRVLKAIASSIAGGSTGSRGGPAVADDTELDSRFGDPTVRRDPKHWAGDSYTRARYSECPSDYLLLLAESIEYFAAKDKEKADPPKHRNGTPWWQLNLKDAARARGWARRNKGKTKPPPQREDASDGSGAGAGDEYDQSPEPGVEDYGDSQEWVP